MKLDPWERSDPMEQTFPVLTTCKYEYVRTFHLSSISLRALKYSLNTPLSQFGTAGGKAWVDAICVLPNNVVHQKFYLLLWVWLLFLTLATALHQVPPSTHTNTLHSNRSSRPPSSLYQRCGLL